ncbi:hypothetical protein AX15_007536 [Amanita polypyramis BW_CC]|nr:hypothetical protein AX15_007536 [Amanita polypyramis BW_CC]
MIAYSQKHWYVTKGSGWLYSIAHICVRLPSFGKETSVKVAIFLTPSRALDIVHTALIWDGLWIYLIQGFGNESRVDFIPLPIALTISFTAILTLLVHFYFVQRIFRLSRKNYWICVPIVVLAVGRVCSASGTSAEMIREGTFSNFRDHYRWLFSLGLAISSTVDVIITVSLFILLRMSRSRSLSLNDVIDSLILYTFEIGSLTGLASIVAMICWLAVKNNLIFLGLHFVVGKLYANSLMASLNMRYHLRRAHARSGSSGGVVQRPGHITIYRGDDQSNVEMRHVQINVEKSIQYDDERPISMGAIDYPDKTHSSTT